MQQGWIRVSKSNRCAICSSDSWCCIGLKFINCCRVQSDKPASNGVGWLHPLDAKTIRPIFIPSKPVKEVTIDAQAIMNKWRTKTSLNFIDDLAMRLGVSPLALINLGVAWSSRDQAFAFPMYNGKSEMIGIRLRSLTGQKWAVKGSHQGLFIPGMIPKKELMVCEGPTDTAAALTIGLFAVGRPSCLGCENDINELIKLNGVKRVVICADRDEPGQNGAEKLQSSLAVPSIIYTPPAKDLREAVAGGMTLAMFNSQIKSVVWTTPKS